MPVPHAPHPNRPGFTLIELLVVISIIALLIGILLPALGAAREASRTSVSLSNVRQLSIAYYSYATDNKEYSLPFVDNFTASASALRNSNSHVFWTARLTKEGYLPGGVAFVCPSMDGDHPILEASVDTDTELRSSDWARSDYGYNFAYLGTSLGPRGLYFFSGDAARDSLTPRVDTIRNASDTIAFTDSMDFGGLIAGAGGAAGGRGGTSNEPIGVPYLFPYYDPPPQQYGFADARHQRKFDALEAESPTSKLGGSIVNVGFTDGHASGVSINQYNNPYQEEELTDDLVAKGVAGVGGRGGGSEPYESKWNLN